MKCPCCGGEIEKDQLFFAEWAVFSNNKQMKVQPSLREPLKLLYKNLGNIVPHKDLRILYIDFSSKVSDLNRELRASNSPFEIRSRRGEGYYLVNKKWKR